MKLEEIDEFFSFSDMNYSCMEYVEESLNGYDVLYTGSFCGRVSAFLFAKRKVPRTLRPEDISRDMRHSGEVTCLLHSHNKKLSSDSAAGVLYSGSTDRTIKVWLANTSSPKLVQTLYGHEGTITALADAHDGTVLSCSADGSLRLWKPQRGRNFLAQTFLECTCLVRHKEVWLSSMVVNFINSWACYVADMDGNIDIYKKGSELNEAEHRTAVFTGQLTKHRRWEKVHRLGITRLSLVAAEGLLVTASSDFSAKILDMHLGTTLFSINNPRNCKYTGIVWDTPQFQVYLCDENGFMEVWSSFYERTVETFVMSTWSGAVRVGRGDGVGPKANLLAQPLVSCITQHKSPGLLVTLHPRAGNAAIWELSNEGTVAKFEGHDGKLILSLGVLENPAEGLAPPAASSSSALTDAAPRHPSREETKGGHDLISLEESTFFSVGEDNMMCCWDEYDRTERYSIRLKHSSEVVSVLTIWPLHSIVTAHDCGALCLWNIDAGTKVLSNDMKGSAITAMAVGKNKHHDDVLLAVDRDGKIGVWNLTLFKAHLSMLPLESVFMGYHDPEDPSIVSVDAHIPSGTVFTGGADGYIKFWRLKLDNEAQSLDFHDGDAIWNLHVRQHFLLSGDETGRIVLWSIREANEKAASAGATSPPAHTTASSRQGSRSSYRITLTKLACWSSAMAGSFQCCYLDQINGSAYVCFTDSSCNFTDLWRVSMRGGGHFNSLGVSDTPLAPLGKEKRKRRVSMEMDLEAKATISSAPLDVSPSSGTGGAGDKMLNLENLQLASAKDQQDDSKAGGMGELSVPFQGSEEPRGDMSDSAQPSARSRKASSAASCSRRPSVAATGATMTIFPNLLSIQLRFDTIATIKHDGVEPSCMRCRVGNGSLAAQSQGGSTSRRGSERKEKGNKSAETCVYLGLMDGSVQKHILGEVF